MRILMRGVLLMMILLGVLRRRIRSGASSGLGCARAQNLSIKEGVDLV